MFDIVDNLELKDVFISHSHADKDEFIKPLVAALNGVNITCWYDELEIVPGDSLAQKINYGLTHSKLIVFCLSENFLNGGWSIKELTAAIGLTMISGDKYRMVPLMLDNPQTIQEKYPIPFGDMTYIRWDKNIDNTVKAIKKSLSEIDKTGKSYWLEEARSAYRKEDFTTAAIYSKRSSEFDNKSFSAFLIQIASLFHLKRMDDIWNLIYLKQDDLPYMKEDDAYQTDADIFNFVQDKISDKVVGDEINKTGFSFAIMDFLTRESKNPESWRYVKRLYDKPSFKFHQDNIVLCSAYFGKEQSIDWLKEVALNSKERKVKEAIANIIYPMAANLKGSRKRIVEIADILSKDSKAEVRALSLITLYFYDNSGSRKALSALKDPASKVRFQAFKLLSGKYNIEIDENWQPKSRFSREKRAADRLLTADAVKELLDESDDSLFQDIVECIIEKKIPCPEHIDINQIINDRGPGSEARGAKVKLFASEDSIENHNQLIELAFSDSDARIRSAAYRALKDGNRAIKNDLLRNMFENESSSNAREEMFDLILEKGDSDLADIYYKILENKIEDSILFPETALERILNSSNKKIIASAIILCISKDKTAKLASKISWILNQGFTKETLQIVSWCLDNQTNKENAILASGKLSDFPVDRIRGFVNDTETDIRIAALRALEFRNRDGNSLTVLNKLFKKSLEEIARGELQAGWTTLKICDAFLEFEGPSNTIPLLKKCYDALYQTKESFFPLRAAWERLKILGVTIPHDVYQDSSPTTPYPWPDRSGPFYGIAPED